MIVTLNELQRACQKSLFGFPAPAGSDDDAAVAAVWLESRGLSALAPLVAALDRWRARGAVDRLVPPDGVGPESPVPASGASAVALCGPVVDLALVAAARAGGTATLTVTDLRDPQFLLPLAAQLLCRGWRWRILWGRGEGPIAGAALSESAGTALLGAWDRPLPQDPFEVTVTCRQGGVLPSQDAPAVAIAESVLTARRRATLAAGLELDDALWARLSAYAARALVPTSADSRARGAGMQASDND